MNKREKQQVVHCNAVVTLKDGKGVCPQCKRPITVLSYEVGKAPEKPSRKKKPYTHTVSLPIALYGALFIIALVVAYAMWMAGQLWVVVVCAAIYLVFRLIFGGSKRKA